MINGLGRINENSQSTSHNNNNFSSTQTTSALKNSSSGSSTAAGNPAAAAATTNTSLNQDPSGPDFNPNDICSPHELIGWVDEVLEKLEAKFTRIETDVIERLDVLGTRIDSLELSMSGLLDGASNTTTTTTVQQPHESPKKVN